jgi:hypothetical protein
MYLEEPETIRRVFTSFAKSKIGSKYSIIDVNSLGLPEEKQIKKILSKPMEEVRNSYLIYLFFFKLSN